MNDILKFRVFNEETKKYINSDFYINNDAELYYWDYYDLIRYPYKYKVEQCTGLKDKNGQLIYEGDIVVNYAFIDVVVFKDGVYSTSRSIGNQPLIIHNDIEVVGTYNENPELLEK